MKTHSSAEPQSNAIQDSAASIYSCSTSYSSAPPSFIPSSWYILKSDIDRSLKTFHTEFDTSCFDQMEDQLLDCPLESFAAMCYQDAIEQPFINQPDRSALIEPSSRVNWQEDEDTLDSDDSNSSVKFASMDQPAKIDDPFIQTLPTPGVSKRDISFTVTFPFLLHDPATTMGVSNPHESIHYYPTVLKKTHARRNTLSNTLHRIRSLPKFIPPLSSPSS